MASEKGGAKQMADDELKSAVSALITDSVQYVDSELAPLRAKATDYYKGKRFGNEEDGRSQFVMTEVRDAVLGVMPSLLRVFFGPERVVEFAPRNKAGVAAAKQATDYIQFVVAEDNPGFLEAHAFLKDALVRKTGIVKWWWDDASAAQTYKLRLLQDELEQLLAANPNAELLRAHDAEDDIGRAQGVVEAEVKVSEPDGRARFKAVPPDQFLITRNAASVDDADFVGHRMRLTKSELLALGVSEKDIDAHGGDDTSTRDGAEAQARSVSGLTGAEPESGEANRRYLYVEGYPRIDYDGDGTSEIRKVCTLGPGHAIVENTPVDERPFAVGCPDPEPHTLVGDSFADRVMDLQLLNSSLVRGMNDSLAASIFPRMVYVEGMVNPQDILNTEIGAPVRAMAPGMVQSVAHPFVGAEVLPIMQFMADVRESRTGLNKGAMGLDADALQSSTQSAVGAALTMSQQQIELIARLMAEQIFKPLFRGLYKLFVKHRPKSRMVKLRGEWVEVDPAAWDADAQVVVNVGLGTTLVEQKVAALMGVKAAQEEILTTLGPSNPLCSLAQYSNTLTRLVELSGFKDTDSFFSVLPPDFQLPPAPPQPDPNAAFVQIEQAKAQHAAQMAEAQHAQKVTEWQARLAFDQQQAAEKRELEDAKMAQELVLKTTELQMQYKTDVDLAEMQGQIELAKHERGLAYNHAEQTTRILTEQQRAAAEHALKLEDRAHETALEAHRIEAERDVGHAEAAAKGKQKPAAP